MCRADVRPGSHHGDVGRLRDVEPGRGGAGARGRDEDHHGQGRAEDLLDDVAHRGVEPTRRVHRDDERVGLPRDGLVDRGGDVVVGDRVDDPVEGRDQDVRLGGAGLNRGQQNGQHGGREKEPGGPRHDLIIAPVYGAVVRRMGTWPNAWNRSLR